MATSDEKRKGSFEPAIEGVKRLKIAEQYTDLIIVCNGEEWYMPNIEGMACIKLTLALFVYRNVHKVWVCAQSEFFQKACSGSFSEANDNKITLNHDNPKIIGALIHFMYNFDYEEPRAAQSDLNNLAFDIEMYMIADKYFVPTLKQLAANNFAHQADKVWDKEEFFNAIATVYQRTAAKTICALREACIRIAVPHAKQLLDVRCGYERFLEILGQNAEFGRDLSIGLVHAPDEDTYKCPRCEGTFKMDRSTVHFRCPRCDNANNVTKHIDTWLKSRLAS